MRIGINLLYLIPGASGGTETYVRNLVSELVPICTEHELTLYASTETACSFSSLAGSLTIVDVGSFPLGKIHRIAWEQIVFPAMVRNDRLDVLFSPGYVIPVFAHCRHIVTVHDMLYKRHPDTIPISRRIYWTIFVALSVRRSHAVISISQFARNELVNFFPFIERKLFVTPEAVDRSSFCVRPQEPVKTTLREKYILSVATLSPHKNFEMLLRTIALIKQQRGILVQLVLVGNKERSTSNIERVTGELGIRGQVQLRGFVPQDELRNLYANAAMFVLPSMYEGFGLPVLEAMSCGCPVVCSNAGSLPEIGGNAAMYFNPFDVNDVADKISKVWNDAGQRKEMRERGFANVDRFNWAKTAELTKAILIS